MKYNWQHNTWPTFEYNLSTLEEDLFAFADLSGRISGCLQGLEKGIQAETIVDMMIAEAIKSSEIEGQYISRPDVTSSIRKSLGLQSVFREGQDPASQGVAELVRKNRGQTPK